MPAQKMKNRILLMVWPKPEQPDHFRQPSIDCKQERRRHLNLGGAGGSVVNRNSKFSLQIFAVAHVRISMQIFSVK